MKARRSVFLGLGVLLAAMILSPTTPAVAGSEMSAGERSRALAEQVASSPDPAAAYAALTPSERALLDLGMKVHRVRDGEVSLPVPAGPAEGEVGVMTTGCWVWTGDRIGTNPLGVDLWKMFMTTKSCYNADGSVNSSTSRVERVWATTHYPGWAWDTNYQSTAQKFGGITHKAVWQTHFTYGFAYTFTHEYPCLQNIVQGWGAGAPTVRDSSSCSF